MGPSEDGKGKEKVLVDPISPLNFKPSAQLNSLIHGIQIQQFYIKEIQPLSPIELLQTPWDLVKFRRGVRYTQAGNHVGPTKRCARNSLGFGDCF